MDTIYSDNRTKSRSFQEISMITSKHWVSAENSSLRVIDNNSLIICIILQIIIILPNLKPSSHLSFPHSASFLLSIPPLFWGQTKNYTKMLTHPNLSINQIYSQHLARIFRFLTSATVHKYFPQTNPPSALPKNIPNLFRINMFLPFHSLRFSPTLNLIHSFPLLFP